MRYRIVQVTRWPSFSPCFRVCFDVQRRAGWRGLWRWETIERASSESDALIALVLDQTRPIRSGIETRAVVFVLAG